MDEIERARAQFPIGQKVKYYPVLPPIPGKPEFTRCLVRSIPWRVGDGHIVIKITAGPGGVSVNHLEVDTDDA